MAKSNVFMNWTNVTITPSTGSVITMTEITDIDFDISDMLEEWQADGHRFKTLVVAARSERNGTINGGDVAKLAALPSGVACTIVAKLGDALNGTGVGALTFTWVNAVFEKRSGKGQTNKFAGGQASFSCYSADGTTDPLTIAQA